MFQVRVQVERGRAGRVWVMGVRRRRSRGRKERRGILGGSGKGKS